VSLPDWIGDAVPWDATFSTDEARMDLAIALSRENIEHGTGGPFGACVFERESGRLVAAGVNSVQRHNNSTLHAEMVALMMAQYRLQHFTLHDEGLPVHDLVTSCDPCAMCFGAILWSGVRRVVSGATRDDAANLGFDEGPVFDESYRYLEARGIEFRREVRRQAAVDVLESYRSAGGAIYNG
jgi:tRNA(Arg) A34 adenosine deaminase TadA